MTYADIIAKILNGEYPVSNWIIIIATVLIVIFIVRKLLLSGFKVEFKKSLDLVTKDDLLIVTDGITEIKDILKEHGNELKITNNRLYKLEGIVEQLTERIRSKT
jgi:uncharacterized SAM-binding protein YcdF (DUF218 family)